MNQHDQESIHDLREQAVARLRRKADKIADQATALDVLASTIQQLPVPVANYAPLWQAVIRQLRADAARCRVQADQVQGRVDDLERAIRAAASWKAPVHSLRREPVAAISKSFVDPTGFPYPDLRPEPGEIDPPWGAT